MQSIMIIERLRKDILNGSIAPGSVLLQSQIAKQFEVSRIPVRDALAVLAAEKLVVITPNNGAQVAQLTLEELVEVYDLRIALETRCIETAVQKASPKHVDDIIYNLKISNVEAGREGWAESDWNFHKALYVAANKPHHMRIIYELRQLCQIHIKQYSELCTNTDHWLDQHDKIVRAFQEKDIQKCSALIKSHLSDAKDILIRASEVL